ncbi:hypothetical protein SAY86_010065 [Trapa natans]|uniref:Membrane-associated kinase regulator 4 n=1 Tax=Trapa natans TaxID=22666 RepID=A0AAN7QTI2_TRANT|nr:hypothetical protein SAY86_010065 [Trapa natans]
MVAPAQTHINSSSSSSTELRMAISLLSSYESEHEEDGFIDMEVGLHTSNSLTLSKLPPCPDHQQCGRKNSREFEFHMSNNISHEGQAASPADELFYNGKLLPLFYGTRSITSTAPTPFMSCNVSPSDSCKVSRELSPQEHLFDISKKMAGGDFKTYSNGDFIVDDDGNDDDGRGPKKSTWTRRIWLIKQSSLSSKLKASRAYLRSLFGKSDHSKAAAADGDESKLEKPLKAVKDQLEKKEADAINGGHSHSHRRSFSVSIKRHSSNKISSSSSSSSSASSSSSSNNSTKKSDRGCSDIQLLKRSGSANSGIESPIQGAIAHCKKSNQLHFFSTKKPLCEVGFHSLPASRLSISDDQEKLTSICRG